MFDKSQSLLVKISDLSYPSQSPVLDNITLEMQKRELVVISGKNGSGKTLLGKIIEGKIPLPCENQFLIPNSAELISFDKQKEILANERRNDNSDFLQRQDFGTITRIYLNGWETNPVIRELAEAIHLERFIDTGLQFLSSGEFRKVMILKSLLNRTDLIILDNPLEGLDIDSSNSLLHLISHISDYCACLVLCADPSRFLSLSARFLTLARGQLIDGLPSEKSRQSLKIPSFHLENPETDDTPLIEMNQVHLSYYGKKVLNNINWTCQKSETWHICGPNGSGKTTLLSLVNGDNPRAYACDIKLFGKKRGSGETIWDIKRPIGYMSPSFLFEYRVEISVLKLLLSGFHDSIGLYEKPGLNEIEKAKEWLRCLGKENLGNKIFQSLSEGTQRLLLIIRAFIKNPRLLILDEPCQGLDQESTGAVLQLVDAMASESECAILYVSHDPGKIPSSLAKRLSLVPHPEGGYTSEIEIITGRQPIKFPQEPE